MSAITIGQGRLQPQGERQTVNGGVRGLATVLDSLRGTEKWWSGHVWKDDYRNNDNWAGTNACVVDVDYADETGEHAPLPPLTAQTMAAAAIAGAIPGNIFHLTPQGIRVVFTLSETVTDDDIAKSVMTWACSQVESAFCKLGLGAVASSSSPSGWIRGMHIDKTASTGKSRLFWAPKATVNGVVRDNELIIMREEPVSMPAADQAKPSDSPKPKPKPNLHSIKSGVALAVEKWNADHPQVWPSSGGDCPACGHGGCFGTLKGSEGYWACFSSNHHTSNCGQAGNGIWFGDALDIEAHTRQATRAKVLKDDDYLESAAKPQSSQPDQARPNRGIPRIFVGPDEHRVIDDCVSALVTAPEIYVRASKLVEVVTEQVKPRGSTQPVTISHIVQCLPARVRDLVTRQAVLLKRDAEGDVSERNPPDWLTPGIIGRQSWPKARPILSVSMSPTMRPDGSILSQSGYDRATGVYLMPSVAVTVADSPTREDAKAAVNTLLDVLFDFPIAQAGKSAALAGLLGVVLRPAINGPVPMVLFDASISGAGKGKLADVISLIAMGREIPKSPYSDDDKEISKIITSIAIGGYQMFMFDNVACELGCPSLDIALTAKTWRGRVLTKSEMTDEIPLETAFFATGNGMTIAADLVRRALLIRLVPDCENPEERTGFRYDPIEPYILEHRAELLSAALTIARAYHVAGRPNQGLRPMGSFESWSDLVRSALVWAGQPDPCGTISDLRQNDTRRDTIKAVIQAWPIYDDRSTTSADLLNSCEGNQNWKEALIAWCPPPRGERLPSSRTLGIELRKIMDSIVSGYRIERREKLVGGMARWSRVKIH